jgi:serine protease AprX
MSTPSDELLPIKVVFPRRDDYQAPIPPQSRLKVFGTVTHETRSTLVQQVQGLRNHFVRTLSQQDLPAVAKVILKKDATAKSHRPVELFSPRTCPIIGGERLGELYISIRPGGLTTLESELWNTSNQKITANISTINRIEPYTAQDSLGSCPIENLVADSQLAHNRPLRVRLFRHALPRDNEVLHSAFLNLVETQQAKAERLSYGDGIFIYRLQNCDTATVDSVARFVGTQSVSSVPGYRVVRTAARITGNLQKDGFPAPDSGRTYGVVGIIDSGTDPNNEQLLRWIVSRWDVVPRELQNNDHGSFVAGLLVHGRRLNHGDTRFPEGSSRIVDVVALDRDGEISEFDLLNIIDESLTKYPEVKVWNLSLGLVGPGCEDHEFSLLAAALDERARKHDVLFVLAAGNYTTPPFRDWPPTDEGHQDRICPPADALRGITVGSLAHIDTASTRVRKEHPSPFTRRGPGPGYLIKPELSHYGGNCDAAGNYVQTGVVSLDGNGHTAENIGTSFACPLVATVAANVIAELQVTPDATSPLLAKALTIHSAFLQRATRTTAREINYYGLGPPLDPNRIVHCAQSAATVILQIPVNTKPEFGKRPFPMPTCLVNPDSGLNAEVFMTLVYDPPLDRAFGIEYCRTNVTASLGTMERDDKTNKDVYHRQIHPFPKALTEGYEEDLLKGGFKWSPLKLYYRRFQRGPVGGTWRLTLEVLNRSEFTLNEWQDIILLITIRDPGGKAEVYNELVREMNRLGWGAQDLQVITRQRLQS